MNLGSLDTQSIRVGTDTVSKVYLGSEQIYNVPDGYDIFLIAGQSNTYYGRDTGATVPDATLDATDADIFQLRHFGGTDGEVILAAEALDHYLDPPASTVGFALTFAKKYKLEVMAPNRDILLVPCGRSSSGFADNWWNEGDTLDLYCQTRVDLALTKGSGTNIIKGILWMQGETDALAGGAAVTNYQSNLLALIDRWRTHFGDSTIPFIVGGMVPAWVAQDADYQAVQAALADIPNQRSYTGYANPGSPTELVAETAIDDIHYSADSQRGGTSRDMDDTSTLGMAGRFYTGYLESLTNH